MLLVCKISPKGRRNRENARHGSQTEPLRSITLSRRRAARPHRKVGRARSALAGTDPGAVRANDEGAPKKRSRAKQQAHHPRVRSGFTPDRLAPPIPFLGRQFGNRVPAVSGYPVAIFEAVSAAVILDASGSVCDFRHSLLAQSSKHYRSITAVTIDGDGPLVQHWALKGEQGRHATFRSSGSVEDRSRYGWRRLAARAGAPVAGNHP
jgi:hypothetical protein